MRHPYRTVVTTLTLALAAGAAPRATAQEGGSTFGHARARELAELGRLPSPLEVAVADVVNYHRHRLPLPRADEDVAFDLRFDRSHAEAGDDVVLQVGYTTRPHGDRAFAQPASVALVVDCSGSMREHGKMSQVHAGLRAFVQNLRADDEVAIIAFASGARVVEPLQRRGDGERLQRAIAELEPTSGTNLHAGLLAGLRELQGDDRAIAGRSRRVVLLTDGIANEGVTDPGAILADVAPFAREGIDLSTIGVGTNLDTALLDRLARGARGLFHFVADARDVQKVFVDEVASLLVPAARRPRVTVELPRGLAALHVYGHAVGGRLAREHDVESEAGVLCIDLPDLNADTTGVVLVACRVTGGRREALRATASLDFADPRGERHTASATAELGSRRGAPEIDVEVRKNHAVAVLAQGLHDMAVAADAARWATADAALRGAIARAQELFPAASDADLERVRAIAAGHLRTLRGYVDRYRNG